MEIKLDRGVAASKDGASGQNWLASCVAISRDIKGSFREVSSVEAARVRGDINRLLGLPSGAIFNEMEAAIVQRASIVPLAEFSLADPARTLPQAFELSGITPEGPVTLIWSPDCATERVDLENLCRLFPDRWTALQDTVFLTDDTSKWLMCVNEAGAVMSVNLSKLVADSPTGDTTQHPTRSPGHGHKRIRL